MLNDRVTNANSPGKEFSAEFRTLCVNKGEETLISKIVTDEKLNVIAQKLVELIRNFSSGIGSTPFNSPVGSARVIKVYSGSSYFIHVDPVGWDAVRLGFNKEDTEPIYGTEPVYRWTELGDASGKKIHVIPSVFTGIITMRYIIDHVDLTPDGADDLLLPGRFDPQILQAAYEYSKNLLQTKTG